jgi:hypothetical protein
MGWEGEGEEGERKKRGMKTKKWWRKRREQEDE